MRSQRAWLLLALAGILVVGLHWGRDSMRVDSCLDAGHVYDYALEACDREATTHPVIPYSQRHPNVIRTGLALCGVGLMVAVVQAATQHRRRVA
jgi:hypothetical protein